MNPFDILSEEAIEEYRSGKTIDIETYAKNHGINLDENDATVYECNGIIHLEFPDGTVLIFADVV